jgi:hypothetical protein
MFFSLSNRISSDFDLVGQEIIRFVTNKIRRSQRCPTTTKGLLYAGAANLKFLSVSLQVRFRNFKFKAAPETMIARAPLIPKFASEVAAIACELRNRISR